jgi:hypothetical protein
MCESVQEEIGTVCSRVPEPTEPIQPESEIKIPQDDSSQTTNLQEWLDKEMKLLKSLYDRMVLNYYRIATKCHHYEQQLNQNKEESFRFKQIANRVVKMVKELGCIDFEKSTMKCYNNDDDDIMIVITSLEVSRTMISLILLIIDTD